MKNYEVSIELLIRAPNEDEAWALAEYVVANVAHMWQSDGPDGRSDVTDAIISGCEETEETGVN